MNAQNVNIEDHADRYERGKARRRLRIIAAAHDLIRETGVTSFSMRTLALRAGVSAATLYNLFGYKQAIMSALLVNEVRSFTKAYGKRVVDDPIERFFYFLDTSYNWYLSDLEYYRALVGQSIIPDSQDWKDAASFDAASRSFIRSILDYAQSRGALRNDLATEPVSTQLFAVIRCAVYQWIFEARPVEEARTSAKFGCSLVLLGVAADHVRPDLERRSLALWEELTAGQSGKA